MKKVLLVAIFLVLFTGCTVKSIHPNGSMKTPAPSSTPVAESLVTRITSSNGEYEALSIDSEKTLIYADKQVNYIPGSNNIWLFEKKSQDYTPITEHRDFVNRDNITWTKDYRLIFTEGESTVTEYNPKTKKKKTLLGPEFAQGKCVDACGYEVTFITSPHKHYYIKLLGGINSTNYPLEWVNIDTGTTGKIEGQYEFSVDKINFISENQFIVPARTVKDSGTYGDPAYGDSKNLTILMN